MSTFEVEVGDDLYELEVEHFQAESRNNWRTGCDPGELSFGPTVLMHGVEPNYRMALEDFLVIYAEDRGHNNPSRARDELEQAAYEELVDRMRGGPDE